MLVVALVLMATPVLAQEEEPAESEIAKLVTDSIRLEEGERWCGPRFRVNDRYLNFIYSPSSGDRGGPWSMWRWEIVSIVLDDAKSVPTAKDTPGGVEIRLSTKEYYGSGGAGCLLASVRTE